MWEMQRGKENVLAAEIYRDVCKAIHYNNQCRRYFFDVPNINENQFQAWYKRSGELKICMSKDLFRQWLNDVLREINKPCYRNMDVPQDLTFDDVLPGEVIECSSFRVMKFEAEWLMFLYCQQGKHKPCDKMKIHPSTTMEKFFGGCKQHFIIPGRYNYLLDETLMPDLYCNEVSDSVAPLYEDILQSICLKSFVKDFSSIVTKAQKMGFGTFVIRQLTDTICERKS